MDGSVKSSFVAFRGRFFIVVLQGKREKELKISDMDDWEGDDDGLDTDSDKEKVSRTSNCVVNRPLS
jgi:hypothetical protein